MNSSGRGLDEITRSGNGAEDNSNSFATESTAEETPEQSFESQEDTATSETDDLSREGGLGGASGACNDGACEAPISVIFFDDFESGELDEEAFESASGVLEVVDDKQKDGDYSLYSSHLGSGISENGLYHSFSSIDEIYLSSWMYMTRPGNDGALKLLSFISDRDELAVWLDESSRLEAMLPGRDYYQISEEKFTYNQWSCLQVAYSTTSQDVRLSVYLDGKPLLDFESSLPNMLFPINAIEYGLLDVADEEQLSSIYWDNVVASTEPIDCFNSSSRLVERSYK